METAIVKAVDTLLSMSPESLIDKDDWIVNSLTKGMSSFSKICLAASAHRHKDYSEAKKEELAQELTKIIFHCGILSHLLDVDSSVFSVEDLTEFSTGFPEDYQEDVILCAMQGARKFTEIADEKFSFSAEDEDDPDVEAEGVSNIVKAAKFLLENDDEFQDPIEQYLAEIFASVIILCDLLMLDLESVMYNVVTISKP